MKVRKLIAIALVAVLPFLFGFGTSCQGKSTVELSLEREKTCSNLATQLLNSTAGVVCIGSDERPPADIWKSTGPYKAGCQVEMASGIVACDPLWLSGSDALKNRTPINRIEMRVKASFYLCPHPDTGRLVQKVTVIGVVSGAVENNKVTYKGGDPVDGKVEDVPAGTTTPCDTN